MVHKDYYICMRYDLRSEALMGVPKPLEFGLEFQCACGGFLQHFIKWDDPAKFQCTDSCRCGSEYTFVENEAPEWIFPQELHFLAAFGVDGDLELQNPILDDKDVVWESDVLGIGRRYLATTNRNWPGPYILGLRLVILED